MTATHDDNIVFIHTLNLCEAKLRTRRTTACCIGFYLGTVLKPKPNVSLFYVRNPQFTRLLYQEVIDMPRVARITIENGCYHIITRGNQKQLVFLEQSDYEKYLSILTKYKKRHKFKLFCFCLMPNHVHLVVEIKEPTAISKIMKGLNLSYTLYFNSKYKKVGHLWQDRFLSKIIHKDIYLLDCINYIETNPIRANLVSNITLYPWSSYKLRLSQNRNILDVPEL
jgi:putative transposase